MTLTYRSVKGSALTAAEFDGNTHDLDDRVTTLEDNPPEAISIDHFQVSGDQFFVHMSDLSILGPYALPERIWNFRGIWQATTVYLAMDVFTVNGSTYMVLVSHTSASTFDAGANDGAGHDYYGLLLSNPANVLPVAGSAGQVLGKVTDEDYEVSWRDQLALPAPTSNNSNASLVADTSATLSLDMAGSYIRCTSLSGTIVVVPDDTTLDFPVNSELTFRQCIFDAPVSFVPENTGILINEPDGCQLATAVRGAVVVLKKIGANEWDLYGRLAAASV